MYRFYLSPFEPIEWPNGRTSNTARVVRYMAPPWKYGAILSGVTANRALVCAWTADTEHAAIEADAQIVAPPITLGNLETQIGDLPTAWQIAITNWLATHNIPDNYLIPSRTLRQLLGYIARWMRLHRDGLLAGSYPNVARDLTLASLSNAQRNALRAYALARGYDTEVRNLITTGTTVRQLLRAFIEMAPDFGTPLRMVFRGVDDELIDIVL